MQEVLKFLQKYEIWGYLILSVIGFFYLQKFMAAWVELRSSIFGLEREAAQRKLVSALTMLILLLLLGSVEFILVSFVAPSLPIQVAVRTPTIDFLATPTTTLEIPLETPFAQATASAAVKNAQNDGCITDQIEWIFPKPGDELQNTVELKGTINIPNLGFYKYEFTPVGSETWQTIAAGNQNVIKDVIGAWNTSLIIPGDYLLRLVVIDNQNNTLPACTVQVRIIAP